MQHCLSLCTLSRATPTQHLGRRSPGVASAAWQLPEHHTYRSCPYTEVRLNGFGTLFGLALDKPLHRFTASIPLKSTALQLTLNIEYSFNKNPVWLQARLQSCSHHAEQGEPAAVAAATSHVMQQSSSCQSHARPALVLDCCPRAKKKPELRSPIQCFNSPPCNTNRAALSRLSQHPFSKGICLFRIHVPSLASQHTHQLTPSALPPSSSRAAVQDRQQIHLSANTILLISTWFCQVFIHTHFIQVISSFKLMQPPMLLLLGPVSSALHLFPGKFIQLNSHNC